MLAGAAAERVLDRFLRSRRALDATGRQVAAEALFGIGLWRRRLRFHAGEGAPPLLLLASLLRDLAGRSDAELLCALPAGALPPPVPPPPDLATRWSLPDWLAATLGRETGDEAPLLADALCLPGPVFLRVNRARIERATLALRLGAEGIATRPTRLAPDGLTVLSPRPNLLGLPSFRDGLLEIQDEGSQLLGEAVGARPGETVLDLCAGAGGKTLQLAAAVGPEGLVHACDPDGSRLVRLRERATRAGASVGVHGSEPPADLLADRVLVDAPCSELGVLRRGPDLRWRIDPTSFAALPALQLELLQRGLAHLAPGGRLVYATCTLRHAENEAVVQAALAAHPGLHRLPVPPPLPSRPDRDRLDGFFAAVLLAPT